MLQLYFYAVSTGKNVSYISALTYMRTEVTRINVMFFYVLAEDAMITIGSLITLA